MKNLYLILLLSFLNYSCSEDGTKGNVSVPEKTEYPAGNIEEDTLANATRKDIVQTDTSSVLQVSGKAIVFFYPSEKEYKELIEKEGEDSGIYEVSDDFAYYANGVADSLKNSSIKIYSTTKPVIVVDYSGKSKTVERKELDHIVGAIFTDGVKEPQVYTGVYTDMDYWQMIGEYFGE